MSRGSSLFVVVLAISNIAALAGFLIAVRHGRANRVQFQEVAGDRFDGIKEYGMPMPRWWLWLILAVIGSGVAYFAFYPSLERFSGRVGRPGPESYELQAQQGQGVYDPATYALYATKPLEEIARDPMALRVGQHLFANNCTPCHGTDARGGIGFPDLTDDDWLFGGTPEIIETTIMNGRLGVMPAFAAAVGEKDIPNVVEYVLGLSGRPVDPVMAEAGKRKYMATCVACHGPDGKGNQAIGAPNLTDDTWLFGGSPEAIEEGLRKGRMGKMPAYGPILGDQQVHLLAAYVYSLSQQGRVAAASPAVSDAPPPTHGTLE